MEELKTIMADVFGIEESDIHPDLNKKNCEEWDSFNHIVLISEVERVLNITISIEESEKIDSFQDLWEAVKDKI